MKNKTKTQDIYFCAAMLSLGAKLDDTDKSDPKHMRFHLSHIEPVYTFQSTSLPNTDKVIGGSTSSAFDFEYYENEWANGSLMVNATKFKDALQRMKSVVHSD